MALVNDTVRSIVRRIYGAAGEASAIERIALLLEDIEEPERMTGQRFSESDVVLISYGDTLRSNDLTPLQTLHKFAVQYLKQSFSAIHFLPLFPYSSDDGFSVVDYKEINREMGRWQDVEQVGQDFDLMFDYVLNHISAQSPWFNAYLAGTPGFEDLAIEVSPEADLNTVTRPRALPLVTPFVKVSGEKVLVWTTFSQDQIDLNYRSVDVLEKMIDVLLFYIAKGARMIRMDAVAYLWKQIGTPCIHLSQTHDMVRLFRALLDCVAPDALIITETNVPHQENIGYFGNGFDEAQMVYNFTLPPLLLHAFITGDAGELSRWARSLNTPSPQTTFFNFTASHDGIGVRPLEGILSPQAIGRLENMAVENGGQVSYKNNPDGSQSPYEMNLTYVDAMGGDVDKFLASQAIALVLPGVPAVYIHSLLGSRNWYAGVEQTGRARTINRRKLDYSALVETLKDSQSFRATIFFPYLHMLKVRRSQPAFHPNAAYAVFSLDHRIFSVRRFTKDQVVYALTNVAGETVPLSLASFAASPKLRDLLSGSIMDRTSITLNPYQTLWLVHHG
ncbi:MAG: sugar phosphorylase [Desulfobacteraceae bacterium]